MKNIVKFIKDFIKCYLVGTCISLALTIVSGIVGLIKYHGEIVQVLEVIKGTLLVVGALGIFIGALMLIKKRTEKPLEYLEEWKAKFGILSYKVVIEIISFTIILYGGFFDWLLVAF